MSHFSYNGTNSPWLFSDIHDFAVDTAENYKMAMLLLNDTRNLIEKQVEEDQYNVVLDEEVIDVKVIDVEGEVHCPKGFTNVDMMCSK